MASRQRKPAVSVTIYSFRNGAGGRKLWGQKLWGQGQVPESADKNGGSLPIRSEKNCHAEPTYSLTEVSFLLGFTNTSAFSRAFRRWHGYRQRKPVVSVTIGSLGIGPGA